MISFRPKQELTIQDFPQDLLRRVTMSQSLRAQSDVPTHSDPKKKMIFQHFALDELLNLRKCWKVDSETHVKFHHLQPSESLKNKNTAVKAEFVSFNGYGTGYWCLCSLNKELTGPLNSSVLGLSLDRVLQFWVFHLITLHTYARWDSSSRSQGQGCLQSRSIYTYTDNDY